MRLKILTTMPISLKVLPLDYTTWRSRIMNASESFSFFVQLPLKFVLLKKGPAKSHPGLRKLYIRLEGKQGKIIYTATLRAELRALLSVLSWLPCQDLDAW